MPYHWVKIQSSPPKERRDKANRDAQSNNGHLAEGQIFYDKTGQAYALVKHDGNNGNKHTKMLDDLQGTEALGLIDADEKAAGAAVPDDRPPV
jgi:hypothetical protein